MFPNESPNLAKMVLLWLPKAVHPSHPQREIRSVRWNERWLVWGPAQELLNPQKWNSKIGAIFRARFKGYKRYPDPTHGTAIRLPPQPDPPGCKHIWQSHGVFGIGKEVAKVAVPCWLSFWKIGRKASPRFRKSPCLFSRPLRTAEIPDNVGWRVFPLFGVLLDASCPTPCGMWGGHAM